MEMDMFTHAGARLAVSLALGVAVAGSAAAATSPASAAQPQVSFLNGGIGKGQADSMREMSAQYPVRMTFSEHNQGLDEFVADVHLRVMDRSGRTVLDLPSQGPIFLLRLPQGTYSVEAERHGEVKTQRFDVVAGRHENLVFSWS
jgi:hypothetical protein